MRTVATWMQAIIFYLKDTLEFTYIRSLIFMSCLRVCEYHRLI